MTLFSDNVICVAESLHTFLIYQEVKHSVDVGSHILKDTNSWSFHHNVYGILAPSSYKYSKDFSTPKILSKMAIN